MTKPSELIQRYFLGIASEDEVKELDRKLKLDVALQDEYLLHVETDTHLRQESQQASDIDLSKVGSLSEKGVAINAKPNDVPLNQDQSKPDVTKLTTPSQDIASKVWKWLSGISTIAATVLLIMFVFNLPPQRTAVASLGDLVVNVSWSNQDIWSAAGRGDLLSLRRELQRNVPVDSRLDDELTPLHVSALFSQKEATELLLSEGADVSLTDDEGNTALHMASFLGHTSVVKVLLAAGAKPTARNKLGFSSPDLVSVPWNRGIEDCYHGVEQILNVTLDLEKIRAERPRILDLLSSNDLVATGAVPSVNIWQAAITGNTLALEQHIAAGTDVNAKEDFGGSTPLILSAIFGQLEAAQILIDAGADLNQCNKKGGTAIHLASFFCQPKVVELLLQSGADFRLTNKQKQTALAMVSLEMNAEMEAIYSHVYESLDLSLDFDHVSSTRIRIREILQKHIVENGDTPRKAMAK